VAKHDAFRCSSQWRARCWWFALCLAGIAGLFLAVGLISLWHHSRSDPQPYRAAASVAMLICGIAQLLIARRVWLDRQDLGPKIFRALPIVAQLVIVGLAMCFGLAMLCGPDAAAGYVFRASLACATTLLMCAVVSPGLRGLWSRCSASPIASALGAASFWTVVALAASETTLRLASLMTEGTMQTTRLMSDARLPPGTTFRGSLVNRLGYWDNEFQSSRQGGRLRVATLGHSPILSGTVDTNCLTQLERSLPAVEVYNFGLPRARPRDYAAQLAADVAQFEPDLVLAFVSIAEDIAQASPACSRYDWRSLQTVQLAAHWLGCPLSCGKTSEEPCANSNDYESRLRRSGQGLAVCHTPIDAAMQQHWQRTGSDLDKLVQACNRRGMQVALVLVPSEFQVRPSLCQTLSRRQGYEATEIDVELPQRRLAGFAQDRNLPVIDLLPHFRCAKAPVYDPSHHDLNESGHRIASRVIGQWIERRYGGLLPIAGLRLRKPGEVQVARRHSLVAADGSESEAISPEAALIRSFR
jgi:hypothetical protein